MTDPALLTALCRLAAEAGVLIMRHYEARVPGRTKRDDSPVTDADEEAEALILAGLAALAPDIPVISEEAAAAGTLPDISDDFFLVDPLDGTKEFLARNGEFTVNIALIKARQPVMGVVYAPAFARLFAGDDDGAFELQWDIARDPAELDLGEAKRIQIHDDPARMVAVWSRSHDSYKSGEYKDMYNITAVRTIGSSLKFCVIAAGEADIYPRHGSTSEWDTAAGHAVLNAAGGSVRDLHGRPLTYGNAKAKFLNPSFVARGRK